MQCSQQNSDFGKFYRQPDFFNNWGKEEILLLGEMQKLTGDQNSHPELEKPYTYRIQKAFEGARNLGMLEKSLKEVL